MATIQEIEDKIWEVEGIRVVIRGPEKQAADNYNFQNAAQENWSITKLIDSRIRPCIPDFEVMVIQGNGEEPHGRTLLKNVRGTY
jgi:hypothetical protein